MKLKGLVLGLVLIGYLYNDSYGMENKTVLSTGEQLNSQILETNSDTTSEKKGNEVKEIKSINELYERTKSVLEKYWDSNTNRDDYINIELEIIHNFVRSLPRESYFDYARKLANLLHYTYVEKGDCPLPDGAKTFYEKIMGLPFSFFYFD